MSKNLGYLSGRKGLNENLFDQLGIAARQTGTPDPEEMDRLHREFLFGKANIYGTVSFYDFLKEDNKGKKIYAVSQINLKISLKLLNLLYPNFFLP